MISFRGAFRRGETQTIPYSLSMCDRSGSRPLNSLKSLSIPCTPPVARTCFLNHSSLSPGQQPAIEAVLRLPQFLALEGLEHEHRREHPALSHSRAPTPLACGCCRPHAMPESQLLNSSDPGFLTHETAAETSRLFQRAPRTCRAQTTQTPHVPDVPVESTFEWLG